MRTMNSPYHQVAWRTDTFTRKENGTVVVPDEAVKELQGLGLTLCSDLEVVEVKSKASEKKKG